VRRTKIVSIVMTLALALLLALPANAHPADDEPSSAADEPSNAKAIQWSPEPARNTGLYLERGNVGGFFGYPFTVDDEVGADGLVYGASGSFLIWPFLGVEVAGTRQNLEFLPEKVVDAVAPLSRGTIESFVISASALFRAPVSSKVAIYGAAGIAYFINDFKAESAAADDLAEFGFLVGDSVENALGLNLSGGVNILVYRSFGVFTEVRYMKATADTMAIITDEVTQISAQYPSTQKLQSIIWSGGVRLYF
jgi:hypothetical protein